MAGITIDKLTELTAPTEITNFLVGGGNAQKMKLSTLLNWIRRKAQDQWVDIDVASCMAAAGFEEIYDPFKGYLRFNKSTRKLEGVIITTYAAPVGNDVTFLVLPEDIVSNVTGIIGIGVASQSTPMSIGVGVVAGSRGLKSIHTVSADAIQPMYLINGYI